MRTASRHVDVVALRQPLLIDGYEVARGDDDAGAWALAAEGHRGRRRRGGQ